MAFDLKILIVDGSRFFRNIERQFLSKTPAEVLEAESGEEAIRIWSAQTPELIYAAQDLPDMTGVDLCHKLKRLAGTRQASVILICDKNDGQLQACQNSNCDGVLTKPLDRHKFLEIGRQFLASIREPRRTCLFPISFRNRTAGAAVDPIKGKCLDISGGGVFVESNTLPDLNSILDIEFVLPFQNHALVKCRGLAAWHNTRPNPTKPNYPIGFGVKFVDLGDEVQQLIKTFATRFL